MTPSRTATIVVILLAGLAGSGALRCQESPPPAPTVPEQKAAAPAAPTSFPKRGDRARTIYVTEGPDDVPVEGAAVSLVPLDVDDPVLWNAIPNFFAEPDPAGRRPVMTFTTDE